tara:strand:- start:764 stop:982 length:219 start_codon:yes stop_codon:yes gene_type:complete
MAHGKNNKNAQPYAQNPYGGTYAGKTTKNYDEYNEAMPKQGFKSGEQLNTELREEHLARTKGKTLLTTGITY